MTVSSETERSDLQQLLSAVAAQDQAALKQLYDSTAPQLYGTLLRILKRDSVAEEALQEVFVRIWSKAAEYREERGQPLAWMTSIARYYAFDLLRKQKSREDKEISWKEDVAPHTNDFGSNMPEHSEHGEVLGMCLEQLDATSRQCIVNAYFGGYSQQELSEHLSKPIGTIKSWIRRGLLSLKECMNEHS